MIKRITAARQALEPLLHDGMTIAVGGFGICGSPLELIEAVRDSGVRELTIISNNMGLDGVGLGLLLDSHQVARVHCSYAGENDEFARQMIAGEVEVVFVPQGTLAERLRAAGAGIPAFYTPTGVGTGVARDHEVRDFDGVPHLLETALHADLGLVHAHRADRFGNLAYRAAAPQLQPARRPGRRPHRRRGPSASSLTRSSQTASRRPASSSSPSSSAAHRERPIERRTVRPRPARDVAA
jgi:3-oxoacid CoA-transferase subunit A